MQVIHLAYKKAQKEMKMFKFMAYATACILLSSLPAQAFTPTLSLRRGSPLQMKIDYGVGYDPRNRPSRRLEVEDVPVQTTMPTPAMPTQAVEKPPGNTALHYGVVVLKVCLEGKTVGTVETEMVPVRRDLDYATSAYDPKTRKYTV